MNQYLQNFLDTVRITFENGYFPLYLFGLVLAAIAWVAVTERRR